MNENSQLVTLAINDWLTRATDELKNAGISSAHLDADLILGHTLHKPKTYLHAHPDELLAPRDQEIADARLRLRTERVPLAYIIGHKEFYGRRFVVTTATLIPRPESETLIELLADIIPTNKALLPTMTWRLVDVGTGSGCLGITAKLEYPELEVTLTDISNQALKIAAGNATNLHADVHILKSDLLQKYPFTPNIIIANLPYVDPLWERSPETEYEPDLALFATNGGMGLITKLIDQSSTLLPKLGYLLLEADPLQHDTLVAHAKRHKLNLVTKRDYILVFQKS